MTNLLIFCASACGNDRTILQETTRLGTLLAQRGHRIIYGGAQVGLMGAVANAALRAGGEVIGVLPKFLQTKEVAHTALTEMIIVDTMHERKTKMYEYCDAALVLPGGLGTMDELFEFVTWAQLGLHQKPIAIWNLNGYYDALLAQLDKMVAIGLLSQENRKLLLSAPHVESLLEQMEAYHPQPIPQWMHAGEQ